MKSSRVFALLCAALLLSLTAPASATNIYAGPVAGFWDLNGSPYLVYGDIFVLSGNPLIIGAGVQVIFQQHYKLEVRANAILQALGTDGNTILFTAAIPSVGWWGLRFLSASPACKLEYCVFEYGKAYGGTGADVNGGAINCSSTNLTISHSVIRNCTASVRGGGICIIGNSTATISDCAEISGNSASRGGGIYCQGSNPTISGNTISGNTATYGGGIYCDLYSSPRISGNTISGNHAYDGGGMSIVSAPAIFQLNEITENTATARGGGLYAFGVVSTMNKNTIAGNTASIGGGLYSPSGGQSIINSILWGNTPEQISGFVAVTFSNIQGGYGGYGNSPNDPLFVNASQHDYHLQSGSPCIDTGDPTPIYNDPDFTRADRGCYCFFQSYLSLTLTPINPPIIVPQGNSFQYFLQIQNTGIFGYTVDYWFTYTPPSGVPETWISTYNTTIPAGATYMPLPFTYNVPLSFPPGTYLYNAYVGNYATSIVLSEDHFPFDVVLPNAGPSAPDSGRALFGSDEEEAHIAATPLIDALHPAAPNPFNPETAISYQLQAASYVSLEVYDTAGRLVANLVDGWREAGDQQVIFDGSNLPSGVYVYRITAGDLQAGGKMVLMK